jgi:malate/lactate dehydrogenase
MGNCLKKISKKLDDHIFETFTILDGLTSKHQILAKNHEDLKNNHNLIKGEHNDYIHYKFVVFENDELVLVQYNTQTNSKKYVTCFKF